NACPSPPAWRRRQGGPRGGLLDGPSCCPNPCPSGGKRSGAGLSREEPVAGPVKARPKADTNCARELHVSNLSGDSLIHTSGNAVRFVLPLFREGGDETDSFTGLGEEVRWSALIPAYFSGAARIQLVQATAARGCGWRKIVG